MTRPRGRVASVNPPNLSALEDEHGEWAILGFDLADEESLPLTPTESEVMLQLIDGRSNAEIAAVRGTSRRTVENQVAAIFRKMCVRSRLELATRARLAR